MYKFERRIGCGCFIMPPIMLVETFTHIMGDSDICVLSHQTSYGVCVTNSLHKFRSPYAPACRQAGLPISPPRRRHNGITKSSEGEYSTRCALWKYRVLFGINGPLKTGLSFSMLPYIIRHGRRIMLLRGKTAIGARGAFEDSAELKRSC